MRKRMEGRMDCGREIICKRRSTYWVSPCLKCRCGNAGLMLRRILVDG